MNRFRDSEHLLRFAALFVMAFMAFLIIRHFVVPKSFGEYGHYRGAAIAEIAARPVKFAGHQTCETCHADVAQEMQAGKHEHVHCEACHGPLQKHVDAMTVDGLRHSHRPSWIHPCCVFAVMRRVPPNLAHSRKSMRPNTLAAFPVKPATTPTTACSPASR